MEAPQDTLARLSRDLHTLALHVQNENMLADDHPLRPLVERYAAVEPPVIDPPSEPTAGQKVMEGISIIMRYEPNSEFAASHDEIWFGGPTAYAKMSQDEHKRLRELGWMWVASYDSWRHFT